jgi:hypothetical protein
MRAEPLPPSSLSPHSLPLLPALYHSPPTPTRAILHILARNQQTYIGKGCVKYVTTELQNYKMLEPEEVSESMFQRPSSYRGLRGPRRSSTRSYS